MAKKKRKRRSAKIGLPPGSVIHIGEQKVDKTALDLIDYDAQRFEGRQLKTAEEAFPFKESPSVTWLNITGLHDVDLIKNIGSHFGIHPLVIEDILNTEHRPKVEIYDNFIFVVLKMLIYDSELKELKKEQISLLMGEHFVISFQEKAGDVLGPVRRRIEAGKGRLRKYGPDYLLYAITDIIVDHYFLVLENINDEVEILEDMVVENPSREDLQRIHFLKKQLIIFRRSVLPVREIINGLLREESPLLKESTELYLRDLFDHILNISELLESMRDMTGGLLDIYLSNVSNRMNEVMKVLTIIATIFIPLSFFAGIYGMNFEFIPELKLKYGYFGFWGLILCLTGGMLYYFRRKKWL